MGVRSPGFRSLGLQPPERAMMKQSLPALIEKVSVPAIVE